MAAGDLITTDYQFEIRTTLFGRGQNSVWIGPTGQNVEGLGVPDAKTQDVPYSFGDGSYANPDYLQMRLITIPVVIRPSTISAANAVNALTALNTAWAVSTTDITFVVRLPGWGKVSVSGRPRGHKPDLSIVHLGIVRTLLRFDCPSPTMTLI